MDVFEYDNRAAAFNFRIAISRWDFKASDVSLRMSYVTCCSRCPASANAPESYRIEMGATNLEPGQSGAARNAGPAGQGRIEATLDLDAQCGHSVDSLRLAARSAGTGIGPITRHQRDSQDFSASQLARRSRGRAGYGVA